MVNKDGKWGTGARGQWGKWETLCRLWSQPLLVSSSPPFLSPVLTPAELQRRQHKLHQGSPCSGCYPGRMEQNLEQHQLKLWWGGVIFLLLSHLSGQKTMNFPLSIPWFWLDSGEWVNVSGVYFNVTFCSIYQPDLQKNASLAMKTLPPPLGPASPTYGFQTLHRFWFWLFSY